MNQGESLRRAGVDVDFYVVSGRGWKGYMRNIRPLRKRMKAGHYDVIHAHYGWVGYLASIASLGLRIPVVVSLMGNDVLDHWWYPVLTKFFAAIIPWRSVIVKSNDMKHRLGLNRAIVVPNGVDMEKFHPMNTEECRKQLGWDVVTNKRKLHVLFPATPSEVRKNWILADAAVELLQKRMNELTNEQVNGIELHGMVGVKNEETPVWYNAADAVVLPSFYEGSPNAVKETMACNKPIVTTDMGDCRERIEGVEGCYVANTYEVEEFADLLGKALAFGGKTKGRERLLADGIADYQIAQRLIEIYNNVAK